MKSAALLYRISYISRMIIKPSSTQVQPPVLPNVANRVHGVHLRRNLWLTRCYCSSSTSVDSSINLATEKTVHSKDMDTTGRDRCLPKVELHVHLDGAIRPSTIWDLSVERGIDVGAASLEELKSNLIGWETGDLATFLHQFTNFMPAIVGCEKAARRIAYELCEDLAKERVVYFEARYCPHLLANSPKIERVFGGPEGQVTPRDVVRAVNDGIRQGSEDFEVQARTILCMLREKPEWSGDILDLCKEFRNDTVVGIDIANNESLPLYEGHVHAFKGAVEAGIHRTCHAGETGVAENVRVGVEKLYAERIGHAYHIVGDDSIIKLVKDRNIHLEVCPSSSKRTGSVAESMDNHPIRRFLKEGLHLSINTDDPTLFDCTMVKEFGIARKFFKMEDKELALMTLNAAEACFLPEEDKTKLISLLKTKLKDVL